MRYEQKDVRKKTHNKRQTIEEHKHRDGLSISEEIMRDMLILVEWENELEW